MPLERFAHKQNRPRKRGCSTDPASGVAQGPRRAPPSLISLKLISSPNFPHTTTTAEGMRSAGYAVRPAQAGRSPPGRPLPPHPRVHWTRGQAQHALRHQQWHAKTLNTAIRDEVPAGQQLSFIERLPWERHQSTAGDPNRHRDLPDQQAAVKKLPKTLLGPPTGAGNVSSRWAAETSG